MGSGEKCVVGWSEFLRAQRFNFFGGLLSDMSDWVFQASHTHLVDLSSSEHVSASLGGIVMGLVA